MKDIAVYGIGNALVDILLEMEQADFDTLQIEKASMRLVEASEQHELLSKFFNHKPVLASGGSVANSIIALSQLGARVAHAASIGSDDHGQFYRNEFEQLGIQLSGPSHASMPTGTSLVLVTPDAERTMRTCLGASTELAPDYISEDLVKRSEWIFIEGYLFSNPGAAIDAVDYALELAQRYDSKIAVTFSEAWVVENFSEPLRRAFQKASLVFANEDEAKAFTGEVSLEKAVSALGKQVEYAAITAGSGGAYLSVSGKVTHAKSFPCEPVDLTGAGDMFAGALLYALSSGQDLEQGLRGACYLASKVITRMGARLSSGVREAWEEVVGESSI